jgi:hypothetical protein
MIFSIILRKPKAVVPRRRREAFAENHKLERAIESRPNSRMAGDAAVAEFGFFRNKCRAGLKEAHTPSAMEAYKKRTHEVVDRFLRRELSFPECIAALDAALMKLLRKLDTEELPALRAVMLASNARIMKEMERRERKRIKQRERRQAKLKKT